jgi:hypothetical protein
MKSFCDILPSLSKRETPASKKRVIARAADPVYRAYLDLVVDAFLYFRSHVGQNTANQEELRDLADALHNISGILGDYGAWIDDMKYREMYLRRYDNQWAKEGFGLERFIDERVAYYSIKDA